MLVNIFKACQVMGLSRDNFYHYKNAVEQWGIDAPLEVNRRKLKPKNRVEPKVEEAIIAYTIDYPAHGIE